MNTSYFAKSGGHPKAVSICLWAPQFYKGRQYTKIAPSLEMLVEFKQTHDEAHFTKRYLSEILSKLDPEETFYEIGKDSVMLCFEKKGSFCHRHVAAKWMSDATGVSIREL